MNLDIKKRIDAISHPEGIKLFFEFINHFIKDNSISENDERFVLNVRNDYRKRFSVNINSRLVLYIKDGNEFGFMINQDDWHHFETIPYLTKDAVENNNPLSFIIAFSSDEVFKHKDLIEKFWLKSCKDYLPRQQKSQYRKHHIQELFNMASDRELLNKYLSDTAVPYSQFSQIVNDFAAYIKSEDSKLNDFELHKIHPTYAWISDGSGIIGKDGFCHYELITRKKYPEKIWIELHFDERLKKEMKKNLSHLLDGDFFWNTEHGEELSLALKHTVDYNDAALCSKLENGILHIEERFGPIVRDFYLNEEHNKEIKREMQNIPLNQILYGPPGTGKTYNTINKAISIADPEFDLSQSREKVKERYDQLLESGQVVFTTFHQSMSYEDFIEGIKPIVDEDLEGNKTVIYDIEDGIFKKIANQAKKIEQVDKADIDWNNVDYYKMSLGGKNNPQEHSYCIHNNLGGISWGGDADLTELSQISDWTTYKNKFIERFPEVSEKSRFHIQASFTLFRMKEGDIVFATRGNHIIDAIGKVSGPYIFNDENPTSLLHFRKVDWFAKDLNLSPEKFLRKNVSQQSIYQFYKDDIKLDSLKELAGTKVSKVKNYVLIIDEINRGNVSQIFGELITLIEESKRLGNAEELKVTLPYSKKEFGVPANLYIIGTMNTADRSVEALDTALRRRFSFVEMMPEPKVVEKTGFTDFPRVQIMQKINQRIELLLDKNHTLGHSYFMKDNLKNSFRNEIIPLLQEYFYNDCGKIGLILGKGFVREKEISKSNQQYLFADFETRNELEIVKSYELIPFDDIDFNFNTALETLLL